MLLLLLQHLEPSSAELVSGHGRHVWCLAISGAGAASPSGLEGPCICVRSCLSQDLSLLNEDMALAALRQHSSFARRLHADMSR